MALFKNWKPKTIFGKLVKGAGSVIVPVAAAVGTAGAITGFAKGIGALQGIGGVLKGGKKVIDTVGAKAVDLVTGTTKEERAQVNAVKAATKAEKDKYEQIDRLIKAGASKAEAYATVGVTMAEVANIDEALNLSGTTKASFLDFSNPFIKWGAIAAGVFFLAKATKIIK